MSHNLTHNYTLLHVTMNNKKLPVVKVTGQKQLKLLQGVITSSQM